MGLKERTYSMLIVSSTTGFNSAFTDLLPELRYYPSILSPMSVLPACVNGKSL